MATKTGAVGTAGQDTLFKTPVSLGITLGTGEYPNGALSFTNIASGGTVWRNNNYSNTLAVWLCLCDSAGNNKVRIGTWNIGANSSSNQKDFTVSNATALAGKALYLIMEDSGYDWDTRDYTILRGNTAVSVNTANNAYDVIVNVGAGGTASADKAQASGGQTVTITCSPNAGYTANTPTASGITFTSAGTNKWTFTMPSGGRVAISCTFSKINYNVTVSAGTGGTAARDKATAQVGDTVTITCSPNSGYSANTPTASGITFTSAGTNKWTFTMPAAAVTVSCTFSKKNYTVTASAGTGGSLSADKSTAQIGDTVTLTRSANTGYQFDSWTLTPSSLSINASTLKFTMPAQNVSVKANFKKINYTVSITAGSGGSASLSKTSANYGDVITVTASPNSGYSANTPTASGITFTSAGTNKWTFTMPAAAVTVSCTFSKINYALTKTVSPAGGGTLTLKKNGSSVNQAQIGDTISITATPTAGWRLVSVTTSPDRTITNNSFTMPAGAVTVTATFEKITYTVTATAGTGGTLKADKATAQVGDTVTLTRTANTGYTFNNWTTTPSGLSINASTLKFTMPAQNVSVKANFTQINYQLTVNAGTGGSAAADSNVGVYGGTKTITCTPNTGYKANTPTADGITFKAAGTNKWTFTMPARAVTVSCTFSKISYAVNLVSTGGGGNAAVSKNSANYGDEITVTLTPSSGYSANTPTASGITFTSAGANKWKFTMPARAVDITVTFSYINYTVSKTASPAAGGTVTLSKATAHVGEEITITSTPATGYKVKSVTTNPTRTITNNKFTMPAGNVAVTVTFEKINYTVSGSASPAAGGTVTLGKSTANYGDTVTVSQTPASGYYFNGWTKTPSNLAISSGQFTMPAQNVALVANYLKYSTATLATKILTGGGTVKLTINADKTTYTHKYRLNMGTNMDTGWVDVAAGVKEVTISIPDNWSNQIPSATQKTGGNLTVRTYNGDTLIGYYTISDITYNVRATAVPTLGNVVTAIVRTVGGITYANVGNVYVQNKCAVKVTDTAAGVLGSIITKIELTMSGYSAAAYKTTVNNNTSLDWTSGLLNIAGTSTITVKATDSRGRTVTKTAQINILAYAKPKGTLAVRRVDAAGNDDVLGQYGKYTKTSSYTAVGNNSMTVTLTCQGTTETNPNNSGDLMPSSKKTFDRLTEYTVTMTIADAFETVTITVKLPTAQFMIFVNALGDRLGLMKATNENLSKNGKLGTIELSENHQIYIGLEMLEAFIKRVMHIRPAVQVPNGADFNDYYDPGEYFVQNSTIAATIGHIPVTSSGGRLVVDREYGSSTTDYIRQIYYAGGSNEAIYTRKTGSGGTWGAWYRFTLTAV